MRYYLDCEFNGWGGEVLSMAIVGEDGRQLYLISDRFHGSNPDLDPWVRENVLPHRYNCPAAPQEGPPSEWAPLIGGFLARDPEPYIVADWPDDIAHFCRALTRGNGWRVRTADQVKFNLISIDSWPTTLENAVRHNPYWDAMALRQRIIEDEAEIARRG